MYESLLKEIKKHEKITIFKHVRPDGDAAFSSAALKEFLKTNFKDKKVKIVGNDEYDVYDPNQKVSDSFIKDSLGIVLDTSNLERIDDNRLYLANKTFKIDHHPNLNHFTDYEIVDDKTAACAEILTEIFLSYKKLTISKKCAEYLYCGILTDSINFKTSSTTSNTLKIASKLASYGLEVSKLSNKVFEININEFNSVTKMRNHLVVEGKFGYCLLEQKDLDDIGLTYEKAKPSVAEFNNIKELNVWATIVFNKKTGLYDASLRSKQGYVVNKIAFKHNGGGHICAAACSKMPKSEVKKLILELKNVSK